MKFILSACLTTLLLTLAGPVFAGSDSGTITFSGAIVNDSCNMNVGQSHVVFECYNPSSGKTVVTTADVMSPESLTGLPAEVKIHWLNPQKKLGVIEVSYL